MSIFRMIVVFLTALAVMLAVVVLRSETARLHFEVSQRERAGERMLQELRDVELELARMRNPMLIRQQVRRALQEYLQMQSPGERGASTP